MILIENFLYLSGVLISGIAGYDNFEWYFIFIGASTMASAALFGPRRYEILEILELDGVIGIIKLFIFQIMIMSLITGAAYFLGSLLS